MATNALVESQPDSVIPNVGVSLLLILKLQRVQNSLAIIVTNTTKYSHITPIRLTIWNVENKYVEGCCSFHK